MLHSPDARLLRLDVMEQVPRTATPARHLIVVVVARRRNCIKNRIKRRKGKIAGQDLGLDVPFRAPFRGRYPVLCMHARKKPFFDPLLCDC